MSPSERERAREHIRSAMAELDATRWMPEGDLKEWSRSREGENCERVSKALAFLRAAVRDLLASSPSPAEPYVVEGCANYRPSTESREHMAALIKAVAAMANGEESWSAICAKCGGEKALDGPGSRIPPECDDCGRTWSVKGTLLDGYQLRRTVVIEEPAPSPSSSESPCCVAVRAAERERAAKIADESARRYRVHAEGCASDESWNAAERARAGEGAAQSIAAAIRSEDSVKECESCGVAQPESHLEWTKDEDGNSVSLQCCVGFGCAAIRDSEGR